MPYSAGPNTVNDSVVFAFDVGDTSNSYKGEPTTNLMRQSNNVTGTQYGENDEYSTCQLVKTWFPNLITPIGTGATLLSEQNAGASYWYCLNWFGAGEDGKTCLSAYIYPLNSGITNFTIGLVGDPSNSVIFNLDTGAVSVGGGLSNANPFYTPVVGAPGWYRIGANIEGRGGGWVGSIGLGQATSYTPSAPFKSFYICGIQYERGIATHCTQFTQAQTSRSTTQGLLDISGKSNTITLANMSYNANAQPSFDGTDDRIRVAQNNEFYTSNWTWEMVVRFTGNTGTYQGLVWAEGDTGGGSGLQYLLTLYSHSYLHYRINNTVTGWAATDTSTINFTPTNYNHIVWQFSGGLTNIYINGSLFHTNSSRGSYSGGTNSPMFFGTRNDGAYAAPMIAPIYKFYNRALTSTEIANNYRQYKTRFNLQ